MKEYQKTEQHNFVLSTRRAKARARARLDLAGHVENLDIEQQRVLRRTSGTRATRTIPKEVRDTRKVAKDRKDNGEKDLGRASGRKVVRIVSIPMPIRHINPKAKGRMAHGKTCARKAQHMDWMKYVKENKESIQEAAGLLFPCAA